MATFSLVASALQVLQSATFTAAQMVRQDGRLGEVVAGACADVLVVDGDPTQDHAVLMRPATHRLIVQGGHIVTNTLA